MNQMEAHSKLNLSNSTNKGYNGYVLSNFENFYEFVNHRHGKIFCHMREIKRAVSYYGVGVPNNLILILLVRESALNPE